MLPVASVSISASVPNEATLPWHVINDAIIQPGLFIPCQITIIHRVRISPSPLPLTIDVGFSTKYWHFLCVLPPGESHELTNCHWRHVTLYVEKITTRLNVFVSKQ